MAKSKLEQINNSEQELNVESIVDRLGEKIKKLLLKADFNLNLNEAYIAYDREKISKNFNEKIAAVLYDDLNRLDGAIPAGEKEKVMKDIFQRGKLLAYEDLASKNMGNKLSSEKDRVEYTKALAWQAARTTDDWNEIDKVRTEQSKELRNKGVDFDEELFEKQANEYFEQLMSEQTAAQNDQTP